MSGFFNSNSFFVTTSKAPVTTSVALVTSSNKEANNVLMCISLVLRNIGITGPESFGAI